MSVTKERWGRCQASAMSEKVAVVPPTGAVCTPDRKTTHGSVTSTSVLGAFERSQFSDNGLLRSNSSLSNRW